MNPGRLLILGASARAAAFSALRAGLKPWCADRFADADLASRCEVRRVPAELYPDGLEKFASEAPPGPWMYTGGLEHYPDLVDRIAKLRPLWGNPGSVLRLARSPEGVRDILTRAGLPSPRLGNQSSDPRDLWLLKPRRGHAAIRPWTGNAIDDQHYLQENIEGDSVAAVFLAGHEHTELLGVTKQLVGEAWVHAPSYRYCGSLGPLIVSTTVRQSLTRLGEALRTGIGLLGLFGVDCILRDQTLWPVEINPRYPASTEVLEYACGLPFLANHAAIFCSDLGPRRAESSTAIVGPRHHYLGVGKAILYAQERITVPAKGLWMVSTSQSVGRMPRFADVPQPGEVIEPGAPILTVFAEGIECLERVRHLVRVVEYQLTNEAS
jgi:predicted ATP-grasp superfamily ATP-dependent carboligase